MHDAWVVEVGIVGASGYTGAELLRYSVIETQSAVGTGRGVNGDLKKISVLRQGGAYVADDQLRPPDFKTYDMRAYGPFTAPLFFGRLDYDADDHAGESFHIGLRKSTTAS